MSRRAFAAVVFVLVGCFNPEGAPPGSETINAGTISEEGDSATSQNETGLNGDGSGATSTSATNTNSASATNGDPTGSTPTSGMTATSSNDESMGAQATDGTDASGTGSTGEAASGCGGADCDPRQYCVNEACLDPPEGMVAVPAGIFAMGCNEATDDDCGADEFPYHEVYLDAYAIEQTEVTLAAYQGCIADGQCPPLPASDSAGNECENGAPLDRPVTCIDWFAATSYCQFVGRRLPTEAEWEKAARGTDGQVYPWGNEAPTCNDAVFNTCMMFDKQPVGSRPAGASPYGALDMSGNVFEWIADWYGSAYYVNSPSTNPTGPADGTRRMIRSSAANYGSAATRASFRGVDFEVPTPTNTHTGVGFRCAFTPE